MTVLALLGMVLSLLGAAVPRFLFPVCGHRPGASEHALQMHCSMSGQGVEVAFIAATIAWAVALDRGKRGSAKATFRSLALVAICGLASGFFVLVWPGVCRSATMACVVGTRPAVIVLATFELLLAGAGALALRRTSGGR